MSNEGKPASINDGLRVVTKYINTLGVDTAQTQLVNGSGLSRKMKIPASSISALMMDMFETYTISPRFAPSLWGF